MTENTIIGIVMSTVIFITGIAFLLSYGFASWCVNNTRAGHKWERIFGEDRAVWVLRFVASPFLMIVSLAGFWLTISGKMN
jgi:membrane-anchored protein YejM (alkaline phosphatase superfamily)